jgi:3'(2'), 5'-bisphosphate nucleotidase
MSSLLHPSPALLEQVIDVAKQAGALILEVYGAAHIASEKKADDSPLTQADLRSHRSIVAALGTLQPMLPVLSEESSAEELRQRHSWQRYWLVDPLDGTKEFLSRNGEFTVNIALIDAGVPVLGVIQLPVKHIVYAGARGRGALRIDADGSRSTIKVQAPSSEPPRVLGSRSHRNAALAPVLERFGAHELLSIGSSIKFCLVAEGSADLYPRLGPTSEWDTAAGHAVLEAAGGTLRRVADGEPLRYNQHEGLLNPDFVAFGDERIGARWERARGSG